MPEKVATKVFPIPGVFVVGVPATEQEFESKAAAEEFLAGETGGVKHAGAFSLTKPKAPSTVTEE